MPTTHRSLFPPPDEGRALEQLERLHHEIQKERRQRERASAEFDRFIGSFEAPADSAPQASTPPTARRRERSSSVPTQNAASGRGPIQNAPSGRVPIDDAPSSAVAAQPDVPAAMAEPAPLRRLSRRGYVAGLAIAIVVSGAAGIYVWRAYTPAASSRPGAAGRSTSSPAAAPVRPREQAPGAAVTRPAVSPSTVEITAVRAVWLRAIVDGRRAVERELKAGERLSFTPSKAVSIRAGNGGAVRFKIGGSREEPLGAEGQVLTRVITVPAARR